MSSLPPLVTFDTNDFDRLKGKFEVYKYDVQAALEKAVKYVTRLVNTDARGDIRRVTGLSARIINGRIAVKYRYTNHVGTVWVGLNPISLKRLSPRQTSTGVTAGRVKRDSAFIVSKLGGHVFRRHGADRLPLDVQRYSIDEAGTEAMRMLSERVHDTLLWALDYFLSGQKGSNPGRVSA